MDKDLSIDQGFWDNLDMFYDNHPLDLPDAEGAGSPRIAQHHTSMHSMQVQAAHHPSSALDAWLSGQGPASMHPPPFSAALSWPPETSTPVVAGRPRPASQTLLVPASTLQPCTVAPGPSQAPEFPLTGGREHVNATQGTTTGELAHAPTVHPPGAVASAAAAAAAAMAAVAAYRQQVRVPASAVAADTAAPTESSAHEPATTKRGRTQPRRLSAAVAALQQLDTRKSTQHSNASNTALLPAAPRAAPVVVRNSSPATSTGIRVVQPAPPRITRWHRVRAREDALQSELAEVQKQLSALRRTNRQLHSRHAVLLKWAASSDEYDRMCAHISAMGLWPANMGVERRAVPGPLVDPGSKWSGRNDSTSRASGMSGVSSQGHPAPDLFSLTSCGAGTNASNDQAPRDAVAALKGAQHHGNPSQTVKASQPHLQLGDTMMAHLTHRISELNPFLLPRAPLAAVHARREPLLSSAEAVASRYYLDKPPSFATCAPNQPGALSLMHSSTAAASHLSDAQPALSGQQLYLHNSTHGPALQLGFPEHHPSAQPDDVDQPCSLPLRAPALPAHGERVLLARLATMPLNDLLHKCAVIMSDASECLMALPAQTARARLTELLEATAYTMNYYSLLQPLQYMRTNGADLITLTGLLPSMQHSCGSAMACTSMPPTLSAALPMIHGWSTSTRIAASDDIGMGCGPTSGILTAHAVGSDDAAAAAQHVQMQRLSAAAAASLQARVQPQALVSASPAVQTDWRCATSHATSCVTPAVTAGADARHAKHTPICGTCILDEGRGVYAAPPVGHMEALLQHAGLSAQQLGEMCELQRFYHHAVDQARQGRQQLLLQLQAHCQGLPQAQPSLHHPRSGQYLSAHCAPSSMSAYFGCDSNHSMLEVVEQLHSSYARELKAFQLMTFTWCVQSLTRKQLAKVKVHSNPYFIHPTGFMATAVANLGGY